MSMILFQPPELNVGTLQTLLPKQFRIVMLCLSLYQLQSRMTSNLDLPMSLEQEGMFLRQFQKVPTPLLCLNLLFIQA